MIKSSVTEMMAAHSLGLGRLMSSFERRPFIKLFGHNAPRASLIWVFSWVCPKHTHWKKKWSHFFDLKSWVTCGNKIRPGIPSNSGNIWVKIHSKLESQFDSYILQLLEIPSRILVPPVTQLFRSKWLHFFFQCTGCEQS